MQPFLTARWEHLLLLNYSVPAELLEPLVPVGTQLDRWHGDALVSVVGFLFVATRVKGLMIPGHRTFEEVNLRFYVTRDAEDGTRRRAVVFIRELVPRRAIASLARWAYNEPYVAVPMTHAIDVLPERGGSVGFGWRYAGETFSLDASVTGPALALEPGSEAEFITEHYWGYTRQRDGGTLEYQVEHPRWRVWTAHDASLSGPVTKLYGDAFGPLLAAGPRSAYVALGSPVTVHEGRRIA